MPPDNTELEGILLNTAESKDIAEATLLETSKVKDAVEGLEAPLEAIALALNSDEENVVDEGAVITVKGRRGPPGKDADPEAVAAVLASDKIFAEKLKGKKGDKGEKGDTPVKGVEYFNEDDVEVIVNDSAIRAATLVRVPKDGKKGDKGDKGDSIKGPKGDKGDDGSPDTAEDIAKKVNTLTKAIDFKVLKNIPDNLGNRKAPGGGGGQNITVLDETTQLTTLLQQLQFVGAGVTAVQLSDGVIVVTIPGGGGSGAQIATETVTATDAGGNNVNIDLTQLANAWASVEFVARNGAIQDKSKWSIVGDVLTLTGAVSTNSFQIQYTY
jgi:hypothetical protein